MTSAAGERRDPIGDLYFRAVEWAELASTWLFYAAGVLSFVVLLVEKKSHPTGYDIAQIAFIVAVAVLFAVDIGIRLYWSPRAEDARRLDLISNAYRVSLTHEQTSGYYNNDETDPLRRLGAAVLENSLFSRTIALSMLDRIRVRMAAYVLLLLVFWLNRSTDLAFAATAALVIFSEHILSHWLRLEWFRMRCDETYRGLYALFQSAPARAALHPHALQWVLYYETTKADAGVTLSANIFKKLNPKVSAEWTEIKAKLHL
jgi:hypothetical protein